MVEIAVELMLIHIGAQNAYALNEKGRYEEGSLNTKTIE